MKRREDFRARQLDDLGFGVSFLGETASQTLEFPVASDGCVWIGVSRNLWEGTVTAIPVMQVWGYLILYHWPEAQTVYHLIIFRAYFPRDTYLEW